MTYENITNRPGGKLNEYISSIRETHKRREKVEQKFVWKNTSTNKAPHKETWQKYAKIDMIGKQSLIGQKVKEYSGYPDPTLINRFNVALQFTPSSVEAFQKRILPNLESIQKHTDTSLAIASCNWPLHATTEEGLFQGTNDAERDIIFRRLQNGSDLARITDPLKNLKIEFPWLLVDGGNLLLTCTDIPQTILNARQELTKLYEKEGLKPLQLPRMLHITVARMRQLPGDETKLKNYLEKTRELRREIYNSPIILRTAQPTEMDTFSLLTTHEEHP